MRKATAVIILSLLFTAVFSQSVLCVQSEQAQVTSFRLTLYAHTDSNVKQYDGRILSTAPPYGIKRSASVNDEVSFYLYPSLPNSLPVSGYANFRVFLSASSSGRGVLNASLFEVTSQNARRLVSAVQVAVTLGERIQEFVLAAPVPSDYAFERGSTIQFSVLVANTGFPVFLYWDDPSMATQVNLQVTSILPQFFNLQVRTVDAENRILKNADVHVLLGSERVWAGKTNSSGWVKALLASSEKVGLYSVSVYWNGTLVASAGNINLLNDMEVVLTCEIYDLTVLFFDSFGQPLGGAIVEVSKDSLVFLKEATGFRGNLSLVRMPKGVYRLDVNYNTTVVGLTLRNHASHSLDVSGPEGKEIKTSFLSQSSLNWILVLVVILATTSGFLVMKRTRRLKPFSFQYFNTLVPEGVPTSSVIMVSGGSGSGKTVLLEHLVSESLRMNRSCVFITNADFPSKIRKNMADLGIGGESPKSHAELVFIDCYSGTAGQPSTEELFVSSPTDLTTLGIKISICLESLGSDTDVLFDSLTPLFTMLKADFIVTFVHSIGAKVKGANGRFFFTVGLGVEEDVLVKLEGTSDGVIEVETYEEKGVQRRRLRVKKMRGRYVDKWVQFSIEPGKGMVFYARKE